MLFILDWDGTLLDSADKIIHCMQKTSKALKLEALPATKIRNIIGLGLPEAIRSLYPGISTEKLGQYRDCYADYFVAADRVPCQFFPHVEVTLHRLREQGHQLAVATGKSRRGLDRVLNNLKMQNYFDCSRCADETESKPHPQMLLEILEALSCPANDAVMVGDTEYDMQMALEAGVERIAVGYGAHALDRLARYQPSLCVEQFNEILSWDRIMGSDYVNLSS